MEIISTEIEAVKIIKPKVHFDGRGYFVETFKKSIFENIEKIDFVQDNQSYSQKIGTLRGLHFQRPPFAQAKLVRAVKGKILDIAVDIRKESKTFGKYVSQILSDENFLQLYIPEGFAHGFITLEEDVIVEYKVSNPYNKDCEAGIIYNDPDININWTLPDNLITLSDKDKILGKLSDLNL